MIPEIARYQGVFLRQLLVTHGHELQIGIKNLGGRVDAFSVNGVVIHLKYSTKRLSPWRFTYVSDNLLELRSLKESVGAVWAGLVCGQDGIVTINATDLTTLIDWQSPSQEWLRVTRSRNRMYRVSGSADSRSLVVGRGLDAFLAAVVGATAVETTGDR
jgi:hypothetical protein